MYTEFDEDSDLELRSRTSNGPYPCPRVGCHCTHSDPCDRGWILETNKKGHDTARPCPTCDPERAEIFRTSRSTEERNARLQARSKARRAAHYEEEEASRTRTL